MKTLVKSLATLFTVIAVFYFTFWISFSLSPQSIKATFIPQIGPLILAIALGYFVWVKIGSSNEGFISHSIRIGIIVGSIGFILGFFGPIILSPSSNQGPLLGLFISGPLGLLIGSIGGAIHWIIKKKKS